MSYPTADPSDPPRLRIWLVWHRDERQIEYNAQAVRPAQLSRVGMELVAVGAPPLKNQLVWLGLGDDVPDMARFLAAEVAETRTTGRGDVGVRLSFFDLCPDEFFKAVTGLIAKAPAASR